ncbi:O-antigen ligase family protein [Olleya marilimosa]|uniref:O-antigen ligase family protein n=1 Tax=Olleya marilimosa TaxID=272164 RepID=A0ABR8LVE2_9FLAO|nr:O-antigen ligase family protein [Olleya marilimosa]MBD3864140.1 O-antigen ligase family protein [Olleya marilimosa]
MFKTKTYINLIAVLVSLTVLANNTAISLGLGNAYYAVFILALVVLLISTIRPQVNWSMVFFILACYCSVLVNDIPYFYKPFERLAAFVIIIGLIGPLIKTPTLVTFRQLLFKYLNNLIVVMVLISFLGLLANSSLVYLGRGGFTGLFNHSMFLSPMAAISMITCVFYGNKTIVKPQKIVWYLFALSSFIACVTAGSRAALFAGLLGVLYFFYKENQNNLTRYFKVLILILFIGTVSFPLWESYTEKIIEKMEYSEAQAGLLTTREKLWERRLDEFKSLPVFGIGYANDSSQTENDLIIGEGQIEPGTTWLVILAMTGLFGMITFLIMFFKTVASIKAKHSFVHYNKALLLFFVVHLMAEGYGLSAGSGLFFYFWLLLGVMYQIPNLSFKKKHPVL